MHRSVIDLISYCADRGNEGETSVWTSLYWWDQRREAKEPTRVNGRIQQLKVAS